MMNRVEGRKPLQHSPFGRPPQDVVGEQRVVGIGVGVVHAGLQGIHERIDRRERLRLPQIQDRTIARVTHTVDGRSSSHVEVKRRGDAQP